MTAEQDTVLARLIALEETHKQAKAEFSQQLEEKDNKIETLFKIVKILEGDVSRPRQEIESLKGDFQRQHDEKDVQIENLSEHFHKLRADLTELNRSSVKGCDDESSSTLLQGSLADCWQRLRDLERTMQGITLSSARNDVSKEMQDLKDDLKGLRYRLASSEYQQSIDSETVRNLKADTNETTPSLEDLRGWQELQGDLVYIKAELKYLQDLIYEQEQGILSLRSRMCLIE